MEIRGNDDRGTIWIDLDQDGVFEVAGNKGNEQMVYQPQCCGTQSTIVTLEAGYYAIAIAMERRRRIQSRGLLLYAGWRRGDDFDQNQAERLSESLHGVE